MKMNKSVKKYRLGMGIQKKARRSERGDRRDSVEDLRESNELCLWYNGSRNVGHGLSSLMEYFV